RHTRWPRDWSSDVCSSDLVDTRRRPIRDAVVQPQAILAETPVGVWGPLYGSIPGLEPVAVTNDKGEFELGYAHPFDAMALQVERSEERRVGKECRCRWQV